MQWKPNPGAQEEFISLPFSIFEALYGGAMGGGKSEALVMLPLLYGLHKHPLFKGLILRRTFPDLDKEILQRAHRWYPAEGGIWNGQFKRYTFPSGAMVQFGHCEHEKDIKNYDTAEYQLVCFDEVTHFTEWQYLYITVERVRKSAAELPAIVRCGGAPGDIGLTWVKRRFIKPAPKGRKLLRDSRSNTTRVFIPATAKDNPKLLQNDPGYLDRLELLPEHEKRAKKYGDWNAFQGQVFEDFRAERYPGEPENALHVRDLGEPPGWWPVLASVDWGYRAMTHGLHAYAMPSRQLYVRREFVYRQQTIDKWATDFGLHSKLAGLRKSELDPSAFKEMGHGKTIAQLFHEYSGIMPAPADNDRLSGKVLLQDYIRWMPKPKTKQVAENFDLEVSRRILRLNGLEAYKRYMESFEEEEAEGPLPKLIIHPDCKELIECIPNCVYKESDNQKKAEDVAEFEGDDPYDNVRYLVKAADRYFRGVGEKEEELRKRAEAAEYLAETQDMTGFYRKLEYLESRTLVQDRPVASSRYGLARLRVRRAR